eukprot:gene15305-biopygen2152
MMLLKCAVLQWRGVARDLTCRRVRAVQAPVQRVQLCGARPPRARCRRPTTSDTLPPHHQHFSQHRQSVISAQKGVISLPGMLHQREKNIPNADKPASSGLTLCQPPSTPWPQPPRGTWRIVSSGSGARLHGPYLSASCTTSPAPTAPAVPCPRCRPFSSARH